jgi:hypothetical protein
MPFIDSLSASETGAVKQFATELHGEVSREVAGA